MRPTKIIGPIQIFQNQPLGSGSTGKVFKGKLRNSNYSLSKTTPPQIQLAVKVVPHYQRYQNEVTQYLFESQKQALNTLSHPYIVKCYGIFQDGRNSYLATEFISGGTLKDYLARNGTSVDYKGKTKDKSAVAIFKKLLEALSYLSSKGFVHRDLKPANIMVKEYLCNKTNEQVIHPVIIDFGFSQRINCPWKPQMFYNVGSPSYMAPESYNFTKYSDKSDLWALGVVFYQILSAESFDFNMKVDDFFNYTTEAIQKRLTDKKTLFSVRSMKILKSILIADENARSKVNDVISLIEKLGNQLEAYSLIKKKNSQTSVKKSVPKFLQKPKQQLAKKNMFFDVKILKSRERQRVKIPSFLDKTKKDQKGPGIEKLINERSPRHQFTYFAKKQIQTVKTIKSQEFIKPVHFFDRVNRSTVQNVEQKPFEQEKSIMGRKNLHVMSLSITDTNCSSTAAIHHQSFTSPEMKPFGGLVFNYKSSSSFNQYFSPVNQPQRKTSFFAALG